MDPEQGGDCRLSHCKQPACLTGERPRDTVITLLLSK